MDKHMMTTLLSLDNVLSLNRAPAEVLGVVPSKYPKQRVSILLTHRLVGLLWETFDLTPKKRSGDTYGYLSMSSEDDALIGVPNGQINDIYSSCDHVRVFGTVLPHLSSQLCCLNALFFKA